MIPNNACHLRITAAAGTKLAVASSGAPQLTSVLGPFAWQPLTVVYSPKTFFPHAASLRQACAHCGIFVTAASRRSLASVSVPMCRANLSVPVPVGALVGRYLTNKLIGYGPLESRQVLADPRPLASVPYETVVSSGLTRSFPRLSLCSRYVTHTLLPSATLLSRLLRISRSTCMF